MNNKLNLFFENKSNKPASVPAKKGWSEDWIKVIEKNNLEMGTKVSKPFEQSYVVYRAIRAIGENVPRAIYQIKSGENILPPTDPVVQLFMNPNPQMSRFEFWESIASYINLRGEAFVFINQSLGGLAGRGTPPASLHVLDPKMIKHSIKDGDIVGWIFNDTMPIEPEEMIHFKLFNPNMTSIRGISPISAIKYELESDFQASKFNQKFFENNAEPAGVVEVDKEKEVDIKDLRKIKEMWNSNHKGTDNSNKTAFLMGGMQYKAIGLSQKDMMFIESRRFSREAILATFGVNEFSAGFYSQGTITRATALASMRVLWTTTLIPMLKRIEEKLAAKFFPIYTPDKTGVFDFSQIEELQEEFNSSTEVANRLFNIGYSRNEINDRLRLGMPRDDSDGDIRYLPINLVPIGEDETPPDKDKEIKINENKQKFTEEKKNAFAMRYNRVQAQMENILYNKMKRLLFDQRKKVLNIVNGKKATIEELELLAAVRSFFEEDEQRWAVSTEPILRNAAEEATEMALDNIGLGGKQFVINETLLNNRMRMLRGANTTITKEVMNVINKGIKEGEAISTISNSIREIYNATPKKAKVIARTETSSLMSAQTLDTYKNEGIQMKSWVTAGDDKVRDTHRTNGEQGSIGIDQVFRGTGEQYPGEKDINCRCAIVPEVIFST